MKLKDTIVLGVLLAVAVLITIYLEPMVLANPFTPVVLIVFYLTLIITYFTTQETKSKEI